MPKRAAAKSNGHRPAREPARHRGELQFRRLLEKLPAGAYTCDRDGLITYFNQHAVRLWGRAPKLNDPIDRFCGSFKLLSSDGPAIAHDQCWMALALKMDREYNGHEIVIERPDGQRITALAHANPIRDEKGTLIGAVNVLVDISDRKRSENILKDADRSKNEFLATLAHELRNPLAPIRNALQIFKLDGVSSPKSQWAMEVIERQVQQMTRLIDDLLDIARITGNKLDLRRERIELAEVVHAAVETSRPLIETSAQQLTVDVPSLPVYLNGDLTRLAQVIANLLNNASKYTERGGEITLSAERQGSDAVVTVRDTGIGIAADMLPRIFDMFAQGPRPLDHAHGGLGIGLTLVKRLVELHGGSISARSAGLGQGSEFVVRLPLVIEVESTRASTPRQPEQRAGAGSLRILVVDDNRDSAASLGMLLRFWGNHIYVAHDGVEAIEMAEKVRPDVVLLDIGLPKLNGYDAARKIREAPWGRGVILIATTGWGQDADRQRSKDAGFDHHLVKPIDPAALVGLLGSIHQPATSSH